MLVLEQPVEPLTVVLRERKPWRTALRRTDGQPWPPSTTCVMRFIDAAGGVVDEWVAAVDGDQLVFEAAAAAVDAIPASARVELDLDIGDGSGVLPWADGQVVRRGTRITP